MQKDKIIKTSVVFASFGLAILAFVLYTMRPRPVGLFCDHPVFDLGEISVRGNTAHGRHRFVLENNTGGVVEVEKVQASCSCIHLKMEDNLIPDGQKRFLQVEMMLEAGQIWKRDFEIIVVFKNKEIEPLRLKISGRAELTAYTEPKSLYLGSLFSEETRQECFNIYYPAKKKQPKFLRKLKLDDPKLMTVSSLPKDQEISLKKDESGREYYMHSARVCVVFTADSSLRVGLGESKMTVSLVDDSQFTIPLSWNIRPHFVFGSEKYFLMNLKQGEKRIFQIICTLKNDFEKKLEVKGEGLRIVEKEKHGTQTIVTLEYTALKEAVDNAVVGELILETEESARHILPVLSMTL